MLLAILLAQLTMNLASPQQTIRGFGVAISAEQQSMDAATADLLWSGNGINLAFARAHSSSYGPGLGYWGPAGTLGDSATTLGIMKMAQARGAQIIMMPLSCPASMKSNSSTAGGSLNAGSYTACANYMVSTIQDALILGITINIIEYQNEPDVDTTALGYEGTTFTAAQLVSFIDVAGPILRAAFPSAKLIASSASQWQNTWAGSAYVPAILADGTAPTYVDAISMHTYGSPDVSGAPGSTGSRELWMTEMSYLPGTNTPGDATMTKALTAASWIFDSLSTGNVSAWVWWSWRPRFSDDNSGLLLLDGTVSKRLYVLGNWSKFARPGMVRFPLTGTPPTNVSVTSFKDPTSNNIAIVVINNQASTQALTVALDSTSKCKVTTPWITDATHNLTSVTPINLVAGVISYTLTANSVTTLVCNGT